MAAPSEYSTAQIALHWLTASLLVGNWIVSDGMGRVWRARMESGATGFEGNTLHVWIGSAVLAVVLVRLVLRLVNGAPPLPSDEPALLRYGAAVSHWLLYALMLAVPVSGALAWYVHVRAAGGLHETLVNLLIALVALHTAAALYHRYVRRDGVLQRMVRPRA